jgi:hypothetical protein
VSVAVTVAHAPARNRHRPVSVGHGAVGSVVSQVARGSAGDVWVVGVGVVAVAVAVGVRGEGGRGRRVQLVGKGSVSVLLEMLWWGRIMVGRVASTRGCWLLLLACGGCKGCHGSSALWVPRYAGGSTFSNRKKNKAGQGWQVKNCGRVWGPGLISLACNGRR